MLSARTLFPQLVRKSEAVWVQVVTSLPDVREDDVLCDR